MALLLGRLSVPSLVPYLLNVGSHVLSCRQETGEAETLKDTKSDRE